MEKEKEKTAVVEAKRLVSEQRVKSLLGVKSSSHSHSSISTSTRTRCATSSSSSSAPSTTSSSTSSSCSSQHRSHTALNDGEDEDGCSGNNNDDYEDEDDDNVDGEDDDVHGHGHGQSSVCPLEMRYGLGLERPLAAFEAMSGVCFSALTVVPPMLQEGWCLCDGELSDLFEALSMSVSGAESTHAEGHEQVHDHDQEQEQGQRVGRGEKKYERDTVGGREGNGISTHYPYPHHHHSDDQPVEGGSLRKPPVTVPVQTKGLSSAALQALDIVRLYL